MFNYAVKYYDLRENPCTKAGSMGKSNAEEMQFWTKTEFEQFITAVQDKPASYTAFMTMYYTGMRVGELCALTQEDVNLENNTITINKLYNFKKVFFDCYFVSVKMLHIALFNTL